MLRYPPEISGASVEIYRCVSDIDLKIWRFEPADYQPDHPSKDQRPAAVFFFGGGFRMGSPEQFVPQAKHLASRGMVSLLADYRVSERHEARGYQCVEDAKAALRWIRANAPRLGIDPERIAAAGGSAGGMLATATALLPGYDDPMADHATSPMPNALLLFNPVVVLAPIEGYPLEQARLDSLAERMGVPPATISPYHHIRADLPPTLLFHGQADTTVPYATAKYFTEKMQALGNRCELVGYAGQEHGFFNYGRGDGAAYRDTVGRMDLFLVSLGWLEKKV